jgi:pimeloyl-ACP methyl ester carboxylesterase
VRYPPGSIQGIEDLVAAGDMEGAIVAVLVGILELTEDEIDSMRSSPLWPTRLAAGPTVPRECRVEDSWEYQPGQFDGITAPTLLLTGSESLPAVVRATHLAAAAISHARIRVLEGHAHFAHKTDPTMVAAVIRQFVRS